VSKSDPVTMSWELTNPENRPRSTFAIQIYTCESDIAPTRRAPDVMSCATISFPVKWNELESRDGVAGQRYKFVQFDVKMTLAGMGKLDFATYIEGRMVARRDVKVKLGAA